MRTIALATILCTVAVAQEPKAERELEALAESVEGFSPVQLPAAGEVTLTEDQSLTVDDLRGVVLDESPPVPGEPAEAYPEKMTDAFGPGEAPYVAEGIEPFRFRYFNCEFNYGGWHNWGMADYAAAHGFNVLYPYNHAPEEWLHVPEGTSWLRWGGFVNWHEWMPENDIPDGRYDLLGEVDVEQKLTDAGTFERKPGYDYLMIDLEHGLLSPEKLREQEWYPADGTDAERAAFEKRYYDGYAETYVGPVKAARDAGWENISLYGWEPFPLTWFGLEKVELDPDAYWRWNAFGRQIYEAVDILDPSVYCFYWSPQNVAYTLASIDLNMRLVDTMPEKKPVRPYYWTLLHGGGTGWRWWKNQPQRDEDMRAMTAMCFFTGCDGFDSWNWSGTGSHHTVDLDSDAEAMAADPYGSGADIMVGEAFECEPEGGGEALELARYDVLHLVEEEEEGVSRFQLIDKGNQGENYGVGPGHPVYAMPKDDLRPHLRPQSAPVAAMVEGMALVKPLEYLLKHGEVKIDVPAQEQFAETLPIVRRVEHSPYHVLVTYDPVWAEADGPREVRISIGGREVVLPADAETRIWVVREP